MQFGLDALRAAAQLVYSQMSPTPQYAWPLLRARVGTDVWVKHENHTPTGAFKVRGGITYLDWLRHAHPEITGICTATRGNHGQSQARAAHAVGLRAKIFVPNGNSVEKNDAMRAFGADLIETGADFEAARDAALSTAKDENLFMVPSFDPELVRGVATYGLELFQAVPDLDTVYVPIGLGSGICGTILARDALGMKTDVVGVVAEAAPYAKLSFEARHPITANSSRTFADGLAVRVPVQAAVDIFSKGAARVVSVSETEIAEAMRIYYRDTHNLAEGAGAAPLAALLQERDKMRGKKVAVILSGGNVDIDWFQMVLNGEIPKP